jgi:hypothetical protein
MSTLVLLRRALAISALSLWVGGLTFYGLVVVPLGGEVLGSAAAQGFITQAVALRLNVAGLVALAVLAWNASSTRGRRRPLWITWIAMLAAQAALLLLYPLLGALLDTDARSILDREAFYARHRAYLLVTAGQWLAAIVHLVFAIGGWRAEDRAAQRPP